MIKETMEELPLLETGRLLLTKLGIKDIPDIIQYAGNPKIAQMTLNIPHPYTREDAISWIRMAEQGFDNGEKFVFGVRLKSTGKFIGGIGLEVNKKFDHAELGYWIGEPFWGQGFASESVASILKFGFEALGLHKIFACHFAMNPGSGKVLLKNNMIKEAELKEHIKKEDRYLDAIQYRLTKSEYKRTSC